MPEPAGDPFEALGDPNRRGILRLLSTGGKPVAEIAASMPISRPAVSRHLRLLKEAGMVAEQAAGTKRIYHLREQGLAAIQQYLEGVWGQAAARFQLLAENTSGTTGGSAITFDVQRVPQRAPRRETTFSSRSGLPLMSRARLTTRSARGRNASVPGGLATTPCQEH